MSGKWTRAQILQYGLSFLRLLWQLAKRDIQAKYRGSVLGLLWSFITPLLTVGLYTFLFSVVFKSQWGEDLARPGSRLAMGGVSETGHASYALILFAGIVLHAFLAEVLTRSPVVIHQQANLVKKVVFPLHVLPAVTVASSLFQLCIGGVILGGCLLFNGQALGWSVLCLPFLILPLVLFALGAAWILAALGVYIRDLAPMMNWVVMALMFSAPVLYPLSSIPEKWRDWLYVNPLTFEIEAFRHVIYWDQWPNASVWTLGMVLGLVFAAFGAWVFHKMKKGFADVL